MKEGDAKELKLRREEGGLLVSTARGKEKVRGEERGFFKNQAKSRKEELWCREGQREENMTSERKRKEADSKGGKC